MQNRAKNNIFFKIIYCCIKNVPIECERGCMQKGCEGDFVKLDEFNGISQCIDDAISKSNGSALEINLLACALAETICKDKTNEHLKFVVDFLQVLIGLIKTYR